MVININRDFCKGCGFCITFCPKKIYERSGELNKKGYEPPKAARPEDCSEWSPIYSRRTEPGPRFGNQVDVWEWPGRR